jgi:KDO2-lipid IV(A) lauroyltransferase
MTNDPLSALGALRVLRSGGVVAVQGDRDFNDSGIPVPFFGRMAWFPKGPAVLSLISRSPILPVFILRAEDGNGAGSGGFRVIVCDPVEPAGESGDEAAVERIVRQCVAIMECVIRAHPDQWYCFYPFWDDPSRSTGCERDEKS